MGRTLLWPIKTSFVQYIRGMADGICQVQDGADESASGAFVFPSADLAPPDVDPRRGVVFRFRGTVRFTGHHGMLSVVIADPWLECGPESTVLSVVEPTRLPDRSRRRPLATLDPVHASPSGGVPEGWPEWDDPAPRLEDWGAMLFHDVYPLGSRLDPIRIQPAEPGQQDGRAGQGRGDLSGRRTSP
jgi:hypothetical protein